MGQESRTEPRKPIRITIFDEDYEIVGHLDLASPCVDCDGWGMTIDVGAKEFMPCPSAGRTEPTCHDGLVLDDAGAELLKVFAHFTGDLVPAAEGDTAEPADV